jgi:hypothetical protein
LWTDRWVHSEEPARAAARLDAIPLDLGDWKGQRVSAETTQLQDVSGSFLAQYVNATNGSAVTVFLVAGRPGPVAEHTPDVCYKGGGFKVLASRTYTLEAANGAAEFATALMVKTTSAEQKNIRIYWAWNAGAGWSAPDNPRVTFARHPALYKLYVLREVSSTDESVEDESCRDLMRLLLPALQQAFFGSS